MLINVWGHVTIQLTLKLQHSSHTNTSHKISKKWTENVHILLSYIYKTCSHHIMHSTITGLYLLCYESSWNLTQKFVSHQHWCGLVSLLHSFHRVGQVCTLRERVPWENCVMKLVRDLVTPWSKLCITFEWATYVMQYNPS